MRGKNMFGKLIKFLQCPACLGDYIFHKVKVPETYGDSGVLVCNKCGKSVIVIKGVPIFHTFFDNGLIASDFLSLIIKEDKTVTPFISSILQRPLDSITLSELLTYLSNERLDTIFNYFKTDFISLERFALEKYQKIFQFLTIEPIEILLDIGCGFGCSTAPFVASGKVKYCIGLDSNLFFLLLFQKYCQEHKFQNIDLVLFDTVNLPFPFKSSSFDVVMGVSFFNHFISSKNKDMLHCFFKEVGRIIKESGRIYIDALPNRLHPFPGEVNIPNLLKRKFIERTAKKILNFTPFKWFPQGLSTTILWHCYQLYCNVAHLRIESFNTFLSYLSSVIPEANVSFLPLFPSTYKKILTYFSEETIIPQKSFYKDFIQRKWGFRDFLKSPYLVLYGKGKISR